MEYNCLFFVVKIKKKKRRKERRFRRERGVEQSAENVNFQSVFVSSQRKRYGMKAY